MAGHYLNNKIPRYLKFLQKWITEVIRDELWNNYVDLHINEIDTAFKKKRIWLDASMFILDLIISIIDLEKYNIFLSIPLSYSSGLTNIKYIDAEYINNHLSITPPSFYIFPIGNKNFEQTIKAATYLDTYSKNIGYNVYLKEVEEDMEYFRVIYIIFHNVK